MAEALAAVAELIEQQLQEASLVPARAIP
jgi:hypothetical protein